VTTAAAQRTPPKLPQWGHAVLHDKTKTIWGRTRLTLSGTPDAPCLYAEEPMAGQVGITPARVALIRFAREILAWYGEDTGTELPPWRPVTDGQGSRSWFLARYDRYNPAVPFAVQYRYGPRSGVLVRYLCQVTAQRAADRLNRQDNP
jgi:hypothetical protein